MTGVDTLFTCPDTRTAYAFNQLTALTAGSTAYTAAYSGTDNAEHTRLGATTFHNGPERLSASTTAGTDTGYTTRDPQGTLNSIKTGGTSDYYLTDVDGSVLGLANAARTHNHTPYGQDASTPPARTKRAPATTTPPPAASPKPTPPARKPTPYLALAGDPINHTDPNERSFFGKA
ncbi:hypothetical protein ACIO6U_18560 [Streptomyces sp. NPDC087422]|uniref:hypothetical protein n=1 Tax=Streptomyces sp. NPDC087422 TaxID=3365786 RepID=UPI0037F21892